MPVRPVALSMGEPAGTGGELALRAWGLRQERGLPPFFVIDDPERLRALASGSGLGIPVGTIRTPEEAVTCFATALPVLPLSLPALPRPGHPDPALVPLVTRAIETGAELAIRGRACALTTAPIEKSVMYAGGFGFPGHTEYLGHLAGRAGRRADPVMMLVSPVLRVALVTIHVPLARVSGLLQTSDIVSKGRIVAATLREDFGIPAPRLAVSGLNPHAGEAGTLGHEERDIIAPAVQRLREEGIDALGPLAADSLFPEDMRARYDAALCMYHDQGLIPVKTLAFHEAVNMTAGLPLVRTSPDHGTGLDIAGQWRARPDSLIAALRLAAETGMRRGGAAG